MNLFRRLKNIWTLGGHEGGFIENEKHIEKPDISHIVQKPKYKKQMAKIIDLSPQVDLDD
jgi:hypothetical protein